ncbi:type I 3-dehydroquinate dehydratase [Leuconostoc rapi]|uniref:type I 3-dehydroquinate dehydratase n=1 Tax=Leuconostoc rapi TaxID=1406906 RepID=UPI00195D6537|nr:type I 3-dehydroquinate dehydratase [Leuconostoc rapi]MBM7435790.1 3-dehydroquinate dehydratase-1 [Leuconostoc rapi]
MTLREVLQLPKSITNKPVIAVPLTLGPTDKLTPFANQLQEQNPDIVEWRADYIADDFSQAVMWQQVRAGAQTELAQKKLTAMTEAKMLAEMDKAQQEFNANWPAMNAQIIKELTGSVFNTIGSFPIILTYRTKSQGGRGEMSPIAYATFIVTALRSGYHFTAVDIEYTLDSDLRDKIIATAQQVGVPVILSYHDFEQTPDVTAFIQDMAQSGVDIIKLAVMPKNEQDVQRLLDETRAATVKQPLVTMSMGELGRRSRIMGYTYGSEMTFAVLDHAVPSAPGQLTVSQLLAAWQ